MLIYLLLNLVKENLDLYLFDLLNVNQLYQLPGDKDFDRIPESDVGGNLKLRFSS